MTTFFVFCSKCGFYPSDSDDVALGIEGEEKATNLADLHEGDSHHTFLIPDRWMDTSITTNTIKP